MNNIAHKSADFRVLGTVVVVLFAGGGGDTIFVVVAVRDMGTRR
jgi:hypothetical protein